MEDLEREEIEPTENDSDTNLIMEDVFGDSCDCDYNSDDSFEL